MKISGTIKVIKVWYIIFWPHHILNRQKTFAAKKGNSCILKVVLTSSQGWSICWFYWLLPDGAGVQVNIYSCHTAWIFCMKPEMTIDASIFQDYQELQKLEM